MSALGGSAHLNRHEIRKAAKAICPLATENRPWLMPLRICTSSLIVDGVARGTSRWFMTKALSSIIRAIRSIDDKPAAPIDADDKAKFILYMLSAQRLYVVRGANQA